MYNLYNFCNIISALRRRKGWSQALFAEKIGISPQSVSKWECGIGFPDVTLFPVIAETLAVPIGVLFGEQSEKEEASMRKYQKTEIVVETEVCHSIKALLGNVCRIEFIDGVMDKASIFAVGDPTFIRFFSANREDGVLFVEVKNPNGSAEHWQPYDREGYTGENFVQVFTGCQDSDVLVENYLDLVCSSRFNEDGNYESTVYQVERI